MPKIPMNLKDLTIVIPSKGRAENQITYYQLPASLNPVIAVPFSEGKWYKVNMPGARICLVPDEIKGISKTRQYLMEQCTTRYQCQLDDDMTFAYRHNMESAALVSLPPGNVRITQMFEYWLELAREYIHVGVSARQGNNRVTDQYRTCCRMYNAYLYDLPEMWKCKPVLGRCPVMHDFDLTLQLLRAGKPNANIYRWCWNQAASNQPGGCSTYRTLEMQRASALELAEHHPGFVKVVEKQSKNWQGMETRTDVIVYWKKAYESSKIGKQGFLFHQEPLPAGGN